jgi:cytochrome P450
VSSLLVFALSKLFFLQHALLFAGVTPFFVYGSFHFFVSKKLAEIGNISGPAPHFPDGNVLNLYCQYSNINLGLSSYAERYNYPPLLRIWVACFPLIVACTPAATSEILSNAQVFGKGDLFKVTIKFFGNLLVCIEGDIWKQHRQALNSGFRTENLKSFANEIFPKHSQILVKKWKEAIGDNNSAQIDIVETFCRFTMDVIVESSCGYELNALAGSPEAIEIYSAIKYLTTRGAYLQIPFYQKTRFFDTFLHYRNVLFRVIDNIISQDSRKVSLILDLLINNEFSQDDIRSEVFTFVAGGFETTASLLTWVMVNLATHQGVQEKLIEEVDRVLKGQKPQWDDLGKLPYTLAVINETLRHDAPFMNFPRVAYCDAELEGHCIPNGTNIWISPALVMMNPNAWPNPTQFNPERFIGDVSVNNSKFMAFGFGPRACMGRMFVLHEATIVLAMIMQNFFVRPLTEPYQYLKTSVIFRATTGKLDLTLALRNQ